MTAFVAFVKAYAVWLYLLCALGVLLAVKMLTDARRLGRTTLFSLDQERAGEKTYRALTLMVVFVLFMGAIATVNAFIAPAVPTAESPFLRGLTSTLVYVFPSQTPLPSGTPTLPPPTETNVAAPSVAPPGGTPVPSAATPTATRGTLVNRPTPPSTTAPTPGMVPPTLLAPPNGDVKIGENQMNTSLVFKWSWDCPQCRLGPQDRFEVVISFVDKRTGANRIVVGNSPSNRFLSMGAIVGGGSGEVYQKAKDDTYYWAVQVKRGDQPLTPLSDKWKFIWH